MTTLSRVKEFREETGCDLKEAVETVRAATSFNLHGHLMNQRRWSERTFGPGPRTRGVVEHIRQELDEVLADPTDVEEWIDIAILALDGAWRAGGSPERIIATLQAKQAKNEARAWPDWRGRSEDEPINHDRSGE